MSGPSPAVTSTRNAFLRANVLVPLALVIILAVLPGLAPTPNFLRLLFTTLVWVAASVSWNLIGGFAGQASFGFAVFYGLGAYTTALAMNHGIKSVAAFVMSGIVACIASLLIGLPTFRLRGPYFAIATIGISEAVRVIMTNLDFTGGASGYRIVERGPFRQLEHYYSALVLAVLAVAIAMVVSRSKFGFGLRAIRQDEDAAADVGVNPFTEKLKAHAIAAVLAGMAGGIFARRAAFIEPGGVFAFQTSVQFLLMPVIGGIGTVWGPVLGGVVFGFVEEEIIAAFPNIHLLIYGVLLIVIILLEPGGILGGIHRVLRRFRAGRTLERPAATS
jgi:branched-chain amino acid transport system permease protein